MNINNYITGKNVKLLSKKSAVEYIKPLGIWTIIWLIIIAQSGSFIFALLGLFIFIGIFLNIRSYVLFMDDNGIWIYSGLAPWNRGIYGMKWKDFGEAVYYTDFASWIAKSYKIEIKHRYKNDFSIILTNMYEGNKAVEAINSKVITK